MISSNDKPNFKLSESRPSPNSRLLAKRSSPRPKKSLVKIQTRPSGNSPPRKCVNCSSNGVLFKKLGHACLELQKTNYGSVFVQLAIHLKRIVVLSFRN